MEAKYSVSDIGGADLLCPVCGNCTVHHDRVEVFDRDEKEKTGLRVVVANGRAVVDKSLKENPSKRRHGLLIRLWCEGCTAKFTYNIAQHKGSTNVSVVVLKP